MSIEKKILKHLLNDEDYARKILPFLKSEYFSDVSEKHLFDEITTYIHKYNSLPTYEAVEIDLEKKDGLNDSEYKKTLMH